jgi:hypothetical protein
MAYLGQANGVGGKWLRELERNWLRDLLNDPRAGLTAFCENLGQLEKLGRSLYKKARPSRSGSRRDPVISALDSEMCVESLESDVEYQEFKRLQERVDLMLTRYSSFPRASFNIRGRDWHIGESWHWENDPPKKEFLAIRYLLQLLSEKKLNRLRRCTNRKCDHWYVARNRKQACCSERCRKKVMREDPIWASSHAEYMRAFRARERARYPES